jgi:DnaA family protein
VNSDAAMKPAQLPLALDFSDLNGFDNFETGDNAELLVALDNLINADKAAFCYLWSDSANGKSHLLQAACRQASERGLRAMYIPLADFVECQSPSMLHGLASVDFLALDDIHHAAGQQDWEQALYVLLYEARNAVTQVVIAGNASVDALALDTPDLRTRLSWDGSWHVDSLNDAQLSNYLQQAANRRGLDMSVDAAAYIVSHHSRDMKALASLLKRLDKASLAEKRKLTAAFVKSHVDQVTSQSA